MAPTTPPPDGGLPLPLLKWLLGLLGGGSLLAWMKLRPESRKTNAEARKAEAEAEAKEIENNETLFERVEKLQSALDKIRDHANDCEDRLAETNKRVASMERWFPMALLGRRLEHLEDARWLYDMASDAWVVTTPEDQGTFRFANEAFCRAIGRQEADLLGIAWREFLHPEDRASTRAAEARAWTEPIKGYPNRWLHSAGHYVTLRWFSVAYFEGISVSIVQVELEPPAMLGVDRIPVRQAAAR